MTEYKNKILDQDTLKFCLQIFQLLESGPQNLRTVRQAALNGLTFTKMSLAARYLETMALIPSAQIGACSEDLLDAGAIFGVRDDFEDYLMTVRHLSEAPDFKNWEGFFKCTKSMAENHSSCMDFFWTVRCLVKENGGSVAEEFFKMSKKLKEPTITEKVWEAARHALQIFPQKNSCAMVFRMLAEYPKFSDAFAFGQLDSKQWLIDEALKCWGPKDWGEVFVLAGWVGVLPRLLWDRGVETTRIRSFDIDSDACWASEWLNQNEVQMDWLYKSSVKDIAQLTYPTTYIVRRKDGSECELSDSPDVVINTSCEHLADLAWWNAIPQGTKVIVQSNDGFQIPEHVACVKSLEEFEKKMNLSLVEYRGQKALPEFNRFMLIGRK